MKVAEVLSSEVARGAFPGAVAAYGTANEVRISYAGRRDWDPASPPVNEASIYDLASLTKVIFTTTLALDTVAKGAVAITDRVADYLPEFRTSEREGVTLEHLLRHRSGLPSHREYWKLAQDSREAWQLILNEPLVHPVDTVTEYSCIGFLILLRILQGAQGVSLMAPDAEKFLSRCFLGSGFLWSGNPKCVSDAMPTEEETPTGWVHDENARFLGGVCGNAGLFGDAISVAKVGQSYLNGQMEERFGKELVETFCRPGEHGTRALGWDIKSSQGSMVGPRFSERTIMHTGFTGTCLAIDLDQGVFAALLTNRVHPTRENVKIHEARKSFYSAVSDELNLRD